MAKNANKRQIPAIIVNQWLRGWDKIEFSAKAHRKKPLPYFYVFSLPAVELRSLCGIARRKTLPQGWLLDANTSLEFVRDMWRSLEPAPNSRFNEIDRHILRLALESAFKSRKGIDASADRTAYRDFVRPVVDRQGMRKEAADPWLRFLLRLAVPEDPPIFAFSRCSPDIKETSHFAIISRAALLLRLAAGATAKLFRDARIDGEAVKFWWGHLGQGRGLWDGSREVRDLLDLWADVEGFLTTLDAFQERNKSTKQTFFLAGIELQQALVGLGSCERVAIWGSIT